MTSANFDCINELIYSFVNKYLLFIYLINDGPAAVFGSLVRDRPASYIQFALCISFRALCPFAINSINFSETGRHPDQTEKCALIYLCDRLGGKESRAMASFTSQMPSAHCTLCISCVYYIFIHLYVFSAFRLTRKQHNKIIQFTGMYYFCVDSLLDWHHASGCEVHVCCIVSSPFALHCFFPIKWFCSHILSLWPRTNRNAIFKSMCMYRFRAGDWLI